MLHDMLGCRPVATKENLSFQKPLHTVLFAIIGEILWLNLVKTETLGYRMIKH